MKKSKIVSLIGLMGLFGSLASCTRNNNNNPSTNTSNSVSIPTSTSTKVERTTDASSFTYTTSGDVVTITGLTDPDYTHIVIPDEIDGKKVTSVSQTAFQNNSNIITFKINKNMLVAVNGYTFLGCDKLEKIDIDTENEKFKVVNNCLLSKKETSEGSGLYYLYLGLGLYNHENAQIPNNIGEISSYAFCEARFKKVTISASIKNIMNSAFTYCSNLEDFEVEDGNTKYEVQEHSLIEKQSDGSKIFMCGTKNSNIPSDSSITKIDHYAFNGINRTGALNIPANITSFKPYNSRSYCFKDSEIQKVTFDDNIKLDSKSFTFNYAFYGASKLEEVEIPNIYLYNDNNYFSGCISLKKVKFKTTILHPYGNPFNRIVFLSSLNKNNKITFDFGPNTDFSQDENGFIIFKNTNGSKILEGYYGFDENITLPEVVKIDRGAFYYSTVKNVTMPDTVTSIETDAFSYSSLENIKFSSKLTTLGTYSFIYCKNLKKISLPDTITKFSNVFNVSNIEKFVLPSNSVITAGCFYSVNIGELEGNNENYKVSDDKLSILSKDGKTAIVSFSDSNGKITIPEGVTTVDSNACSGRNATEISIPNSVTTINHYAFGGCKNLKQIILPSSVNVLDSSIFASSNICFLEILNPNIQFTSSTKSSYDSNSTFYYAQNLKEIKFHGSLEEFKNAFGTSDQVVHFDSNFKSSNGYTLEKVTYKEGDEFKTISVTDLLAKWNAEA